jgi:hypothetical protein
VFVRRSRQSLRSLVAQRVTALDRCARDVLTPTRAAVSPSLSRRQVDPIRRKVPRRHRGRGRRSRRGRPPRAPVVCGCRGRATDRVDDVGLGDAAEARLGVRRADVHGLRRADAVHRRDQGPRGHQADLEAHRRGRRGAEVREGARSLQPAVRVATAWGAEALATARAARIAAARVARRDGRAGRAGRGRERFSARRRGGPRGTRPRVQWGSDVVAGHGDLGREDLGRGGRGGRGRGA